MLLRSLKDALKMILWQSNETDFLKIKYSLLTNLLQFIHSARESSFNARLNELDISIETQENLGEAFPDAVMAAFDVYTR